VVPLDSLKEDQWDKDMLVVLTEYRLQEYVLFYVVVVCFYFQVIFSRSHTPLYECVIYIYTCVFSHMKK
jgi:hypothetical protein